MTLNRIEWIDRIHSAKFVHKPYKPRSNVGFSIHAHGVENADERYFYSVPGFTRTIHSPKFQWMWARQRFYRRYLTGI